MTWAVLISEYAIDRPSPIHWVERVPGESVITTPVGPRSTATTGGPGLPAPLFISENGPTAYCLIKTAVNLSAGFSVGRAFIVSHVSPGVIGLHNADRVRQIRVSA